MITKYTKKKTNNKKIYRTDNIEQIGIVIEKGIGVQGINGRGQSHIPECQAILLLFAALMKLFEYREDNKEKLRGNNKRCIKNKSELIQLCGIP